MKSSNNFNPNWASPPGNTIDELLNKKNISYSDFANNIGRDIEFLTNLIYGNIPLTQEIAFKLEKNLGASAKFWVNREHLYRERIAALQKEEENKWIKGLPTQDMVKFGWISPTYNVKTLLEFFNVSDVWAWKNKSKRLFSIAAFRASSAFGINTMAVVSWLRKGEIEASNVQCSPFNTDNFKDKLLEIKTLTRKKKPENFIPQLRDICASCGVAVSFVRTPKGCTASGAAYFQSKQKAIIIMSFRYLSDDHFWFTFFHEAGHILLHSKGIFIEELGNDGLDDDQEKEANQFSADVFLSKEAQAKLHTLELTKESLARFAINNGISVGILIGQLQKRKIIGYNRLNGYKRKYNWDDISKSLNNN